LLLIYSPQNWVDYFHEHFSQYGDTESIGIKKSMFQVKRSDLLNQDYKNAAKQITFVLWRLENGYFRIRRDILDTQHDVMIHGDCIINEKYFFLDRISIFKELEKLSNQQIIIGWEYENSIPEDVFLRIINSFPTPTEIAYYKNARVTNILSEYLEWVNDSQSKYEKYLEKRIQFRANMNSLEWIEEYEWEKYIFIRDTLQQMLQDYEKYTEKQWEQAIIDIILILFPKYIEVYHSAPLKDYYTDPSKPKDREIDIVLLDADFHLDIIEIKKPSYEDTISQKPYNRDNHIPKKNLSSAVMQVEKYIFHLSKWWRDGEKTLSTRYKREIQIINPKWMLIMWRCNKLSSRQKLDFEIIKRQYSNIVDIITYDDLLRRLDNIIMKFRKVK
jgi:hypothetical protein